MHRRERISTQIRINKMQNEEFIEFDEDAEMIDLGIASLETEGFTGNETEQSSMNTQYP